MKFTMVICDDEYYIRVMLRESIDWDSLGIKIVGEAENGAQAIALAAALSPDIMLLDINMPRKNGLEVAQYLHERKMETSVILLTGTNSFEYARSALRYAVQDYLLKPVDDAELAQTVAAITGRIREKRDAAGDPARFETHAREANPDDAAHCSCASIAEKARRMAEEQYADSELSVGAISEKIYTNPSYLSHVFKKSCGVSLNEFILEVRMKKCAEMILCDPYVKQSDLALSTGFKDPAYFSKCFKKYFGESFGDYRRRRL